MDLDYVEYPVPDVVEEWGGYYFDPTENKDKVWAAAYTQSGDYLVAFGRRGTRLNGKTKGAISVYSARAKFADTVGAKVKKGYRACAFNQEEIMIPSFRNPNQANVNWARTFGWWEPSFGDEWLCVVTGSESMGGMVPVGAGDMLKVRLWVSGEGKKTKIFARYDKGTAGGLIRGVVTPLDFPELPPLEENYPPGGALVKVQGVLRFQKELRALWVDGEGEPVGWEVVKSYPAALKPHQVELVQSGKAGWEGFENALRNLAWNDEFDLEI